MDQPMMVTAAGKLTLSSSSHMILNVIGRRTVLRAWTHLSPFSRFFYSDSLHPNSIARAHSFSKIGKRQKCWFVSVQIVEWFQRKPHSFQFFIPLFHVISFYSNAVSIFPPRILHHSSVTKNHTQTQKYTGSWMRSRFLNWYFVRFLHEKVWARILTRNSGFHSILRSKIFKFVRVMTLMISWAVFFVAGKQSVHKIIEQNRKKAFNRPTRGNLKHVTVIFAKRLHASIHRGDFLQQNNRQKSSTNTLTTKAKCCSLLPRFQVKQWTPNTPL